ncbi:hypothetical protein [Bradyrhizobium sp. DOA1]|uniref:hypothetical protein n=1 Tax=Bradyrhizobium sp. DOA1 TaxID=1126616 RepID=UPI00077C2B1F|nr:hypothetical protein [Bradyrhizobium sp. DOA1]
MDKAAVDPRFDSGEQSSKITTSLIKSVPLQSDYSPALQIEGGLIQKGQMPLLGMLGQGTRNYEIHHSAKVTITGIGTGFVVGQAMSTTDDKWLRSFGVEQTLFKGGTISIDIGETAQMSSMRTFR